MTKEEKVLRVTEAASEIIQRAFPGNDMVSRANAAGASWMLTEPNLLIAQFGFNPYECEKSTYKMKI